MTVGVFSWLLCGTGEARSLWAALSLGSWLRKKGNWARQDKQDNQQHSSRPLLPFLPPGSYPVLPQWQAVNPLLPYVDCAQYFLIASGSRPRQKLVQERMLLRWTWPYYFRESCENVLNSRPEKPLSVCSLVGSSVGAWKIGVFWEMQMVEAWIVK